MQVLQSVLYLHCFGAVLFLFLWMLRDLPAMCGRGGLCIALAMSPTICCWRVLLDVARSGSGALTWWALHRLDQVVTLLLHQQSVGEALVQFSAHISRHRRPPLPPPPAAAAAHAAWLVRQHSVMGELLSQRVDSGLLPPQVLSCSSRS